MKMNIRRIGMKKIFYIVMALSLLGIAFSCKKADDNKSVIIYTSTEDFRTEHMQELLKAKFPNYDITVQVQSTGNHAAKLKAEGTQTEADITVNLETSYMEGLQDILADLSSFNISEFLPEMVPPSKRFLPWDKSSGAIIISRSKLDSLGLPVPANYQDLLKPIYKGLISMPNPKSSATGYMFYASLVNAWGEDAALKYFDGLAENILQFTTSGSGPVNALIQGEVAIGLGMTITAVNAINERGIPLELLFFAEGAPYNTSSFGIIKGKETRPVVREVFEFVMTKLVMDDKVLYCPEPIFKNQPNNVANYPKTISYANMDGAYDLTRKEQLLAKWKF